MGRAAVVALAVVILVAGMGAGLAALAGGSGEPAPIVDLRRADDVQLDAAGMDGDEDGDADGTSDSPGVTSGSNPDGAMPDLSTAGEMTTGPTTAGA